MNYDFYPNNENLKSPAILWHSSNIIPGVLSALKEFYMTEEIKQ